MSLNTIYLYIILKQCSRNRILRRSLNTIYLYIILKQGIRDSRESQRLNTIYLYIILKLVSAIAIVSGV